MIVKQLPREIQLLVLQHPSPCRKVLASYPERPVDQRFPDLPFFIGFVGCVHNAGEPPIQHARFVSDSIRHVQLIVGSVINRLYRLVAIHAEMVHIRST